MSSLLAAQAIIQKAIEYSAIPAVVGYEFPFASHLQKEYEQLGYHTFLINNSLLVHGHDPLSPLISVHIDRHGLIKTGMHEYQYAGFVVEKDRYHVEYFKHPDFLHSISKEYLGQPVMAYNYMTGETMAEGIILDATIREDINNLIFNVAGTEKVPIGTPLSYSIKHSFSNDIFSAQIDNLISSAIMYQLCLHGYQGSILFTPEEEIGQSRSYLLYHLEKSEVDLQHLLVLDTCPSDNEDFLRQGTLVLRNKDALAQFNPEMVSQFEQLFQAKQIPYVKIDELIDEENRQHEQFKQPLKGLGITELGQLVAHTQGKYNGTTFQLPTTGYHTNHETTSLACIANAYTALANYLGLS